MKSKRKTKQLRWLVTRLMLVMTMVMPASMWAQEPVMYTVYDNGTLTFMYGEKPGSGNVYEVPTESKTAPGWISNHQADITTVDFDDSFKSALPTSCYKWFYYCRNLTSINNIEYLNTANVTDMSYMFKHCSSLTSLNLSNFDTSNVTTMYEMFYGCSGLDSRSFDLSNFNTAKVENMRSMFWGCSGLTSPSFDLSNFNTANVTDMSGMFYSCQKLMFLDLSNFDTSKVTKMGYMFNGCSWLRSLNLSNFDTANVTDMSYMFYGCSWLQSLNLSNFDTANVTDMSYMFMLCKGLTSLNLSNFDTANVTNMEHMFSDCKGLTSLNLSSFNTDNVTDMGSMFSYCSGLTSLDLSNFNTAHVTDMSSMFSYCKKLTSLDLSKFNTAKVTDMGSMFNECSGLTSLDLSKFDTAKVTDMGYMFNECSGLTSLDLSSFNTDNVTDMSNMFSNCKKLTSLDLSKFNTAKVTDMGWMFFLCSGLESLDLSSFNTANVEDMSHMFYGCSGLTSLDLSSFNTAKVTDMGWMFRNCIKLTSLDLSSFNTSKVMYMSEMFYNCFRLTTIYVSDDFTTGLCSSGSDMFSECPKLVGAIESEWGKTGKEYANYTTGYFSYGIKTVADWNNFADKVNNGNPTMCAGLLKDITNANVLTTIGSNGFTGTFDGCGHTISGLNFNSTFSALFAQNGGTIKNLGILNATIEGASGNICQTNSGTIESCYFMGTTGSQSAGGICPTNNGTMTKCYYLADEDNGNGGKTEEQFISGEVCYLLSQGAESSVWGQQLGTDNYPVLSDYKVIKAAKGDNNTYWATFSNQNSDATLSVPSARNLYVYNATVSGGRLTLSERNDSQVAKGEGVLLKTDGEYVNVKANAKDGLTAETYANNNLVATPATEETINAETGYTLYRLTYNNSTYKTDLGFYLGLVKDANGNVTSSNGSELKATPGKAYLKVSTGAATNSATAALARSFVFPGDDETTGIGEIVIEGDAGISGSANADGRIYNIQGQQVTAPVKGLYIKNNKKVIIK